MNFNNLHDLTTAVSHHEQFQHEIKGKRIRKQLTTLEDYHNDKLTFKKYEISSSGISFFIEIQYEYRLFDFQLLIDMEYPFNRPKVFFIHENSPFGYCQDLLDTILEGSNWGPSMLLSSIFDKMHLLAKLINDESDELKAVYQINDNYEWDILTKYKVELFQVDEYEWKYMIKSTHKKVLGLTRENLLKFSADGSKLTLENCLKIKDLKEANATINGGKFKLDIVCNENKIKYYFGGEETDVEKILYFMNPIQVTQRKLSKPQKQNYEAQELKEVIQKYSELIEYYSLRDQQKTKKYVNIVQALIKKSYERDPKANEPQMPHLKEDIKT